MRNLLSLLCLLTAPFVGSKALAHADDALPHGANPAALKVVDQSPNHLLTHTHQLTHVGPRAGESYFSRDGRKMIFQSEREPGNPFYQIYLMDLATAKTTRLSPGQGKTSCSWVHPDGKRAMFSSTHLDPDLKRKVEQELAERKNPNKHRYEWSFDENFDIFEASTSGRILRRLTKEKGYDAEGSYSPDGQWIAFASNRNGYTEKLDEKEQKIFAKDASYMMDIFIMRADGTQVRQLTTERGYDGGPFFSPDGKRITWRHFTPDGRIAEVWTMNTDGSDKRQITRLGSMSWAPFYHPSGDYLIFTTNIHGYQNFELYLVDVEGKQNPVRVTQLEGFDGLPVFSPDGKSVAWTHTSANGESQIWWGDWDDLEARRVLKLPPRLPLAAEMPTHMEARDLKRIVGYLASEEFQGRPTGSEYEKTYTSALADFFKSLGLQPAGENGTYFHSFEFTSAVHLGNKNDLTAKLGGQAAPSKLREDWLPISFSQSGQWKEAPVVFAGYGIVAPATEKFKAYDSYRGLDVKDKWVLVFRDLPEGTQGEQRYNLNIYSRLQHKATVARNSGAVGIIFVPGPNNPSAKPLRDFKFEGALSQASLPVMEVTTAVAERWFKTAGRSLKATQDALDKGEPIEGFALKDVTVAATVSIDQERSIGRNVLAKLVVPNSQRQLLIGAHGDHLGLGEAGTSLATAQDKVRIHFGADDNASGVAGVLALAKALSDPMARKGLRQSVTFAVWSGEEIGVLGSNRFTGDFSKLNGGRKLNEVTSAYLNMDMIGRLRDNKLFVQGLGSADGWKSLLEEMSAHTDLALFGQNDPYLPTDAMPLYIAGVPVAHFFTGAHEDYHTPRDTADRLNYEGMQKVIASIEGLSLRLAGEASGRLLKYQKMESSHKEMGEGRRFRIYLGTIPDYSSEGVKGVRISGVSKDSPAEKAGLQGGDTIVEVDRTKIENIYDYVYLLQAMRPGQQVPMVLVRAGKRVEVQIVPVTKE